MHYSQLLIIHYQKNYRSQDNITEVNKSNFSWPKQW